LAKTIRGLLIDDDEERAPQIIEVLSKSCCGITLDHLKDLKNLPQVIYNNSYDCIIALDKTMEKTELMHKFIEFIVLPAIPFKASTFRSGRQNCPPGETLTEEKDALYQSLAEEVHQILRPRPQHRPFTVNLPEAPKVVVRGNHIYIIDEEGNEELWGEELSENIYEIAQKMELQLKLFHWIRYEIMRFLSELTSLIKHVGVPDEYVSDLVFEGYRSLLFQFKDLENV